MTDSDPIEEIPISKDSITRLVPWIVALLVFLLCLVLSGASAIGVSMHKWQIGVSHRLTIEVPLQHEIDRDRITSAVAGYLRSHSGINAIEIADKTRLYTLFGVPLQNAEQYNDFPLPVLVDVILNPGTPVNSKEIIAHLQQYTPGIRIETYSQWYDMLSLLQKSMQMISYAFVMLIALTVIIMVSLVTKAGLSAHEESISILKLIGASNSYVARKFQTHAFRLSTRGALVGFALSLPIIWLISLGIVYLGVPEVMKPQVDLYTVIMLLIVPLFVILLSVSVSRFAVLGALKNTN
jgi:cell division transport system permease protein